MSEPFLAEIKIVGFNFAARGWAFCDGQILPINQNQSLFSLLGTSYGGDGRTSFALPDLRSRAPIHKSGGHPLAQKIGAETVTLNASQMPSHGHSLNATDATPAVSAPSGNLPAQGATGRTSLVPYVAPAAANLVANNSTSITNQGGGQAHGNMQPFLTLAFAMGITLAGLYRN